MTTVPVKINHAVWHTPVPPVCTAKWTQEDWETFELAFKPDDYLGGNYDSVAFSIYCVKKSESTINRLIDRIKSLTPEQQAI